MITSATNNIKHSKAHMTSYSNQPVRKPKESKEREMRPHKANSRKDQQNEPEQRAKGMKLNSHTQTYPPLTHSIQIQTQHVANRKALQTREQQTESIYTLIYTLLP